MVCADVVLVEDVDAAGFQPFDTVRTARRRDVTAVQSKFGMDAHVSLGTYFMSIKSGAASVPAAECAAHIRPTEVRALRIFRFGVTEAARCAADDANDDGIYFHKDAGVFTTSAAKPSPEEVEEFMCLTGATHAVSVVAGSTAVHCVVCRTASSSEDLNCKFCGANIQTGVGQGDELEEAPAVTPLAASAQTGTSLCQVVLP